MSNKLMWVCDERFMNRELWAPYHIKKDIDYYDDLCKKYNCLIKNAVSAGADKESIDIIKNYSKRVKESIRKYYYGEIASSQTIIKNLISGILSNSLAVSAVNESKAFAGATNEIQFFRARKSDQVTTYKPGDMLHVPFDKRGITGNYRFSIPGIPSLYLGNTSYACWIELGSVPEYQFNVSPVLLDGSQKILNLAVMTRKIIELNECDEDRVHCWLKLIVLMIATSYVVDEANRIFKSEYIVSQNIMLACKKLELDGVAYYSKRVSDEGFAPAAINLALFTKYQKGKKYSDICKKVKICDSYNFSMFKQLGAANCNYTYEQLRVLQTGRITNVGDYSRQFSYAFTEFCSFDKFLFATWKNKDDVAFGNALE